MRIIIGPGTIRYVTTDRLAGLLRHHDFKASPQPRRRQSHVEPGDPAIGQDPTKWYASIINGPVLGGFPTHGEAIAAEVKWVEENRLANA